MSFANRRVRESAFSSWLVTLLLLVLVMKLNAGYSSAGTVSVLEIYSIFNTNSKGMARITHLISERSLHRQLPRLHTAYRSQEKPSIHAVGTKRDVEAQSRCIIAPQSPLCSRLPHEVCARFRTARGFHTFCAVLKLARYMANSPAPPQVFFCRHIFTFSYSKHRRRPCGALVPIIK